MTSVSRDCVSAWFGATDPIKFYSTCSKAVHNAVGGYIANHCSYFVGKNIAPVVVTASLATLIPSAGFVLGVTSVVQGAASIREVWYKDPSCYTAHQQLYNIKADVIKTGVRKICIGGAGAAVCAVINYKLYQVILSSW